MKTIPPEDNGGETHANGSTPKRGSHAQAPAWPKVQLYCLMGMKGAWTVSTVRNLETSPKG
jgi:hypothetical protein